LSKHSPAIEVFAAILVALATFGVPVLVHRSQARIRREIVESARRERFNLAAEVARLTVLSTANAQFHHQCDMTCDNALPCADNTPVIVHRMHTLAEDFDLSVSTRPVSSETGMYEARNAMIFGLHGSAESIEHVVRIFPFLLGIDSKPNRSISSLVMTCLGGRCDAQVGVTTFWFPKGSRRQR
jgi:hypothetical protein